MRNLFTALSALIILASCSNDGLSKYDINAPFGFATCEDVHGGHFNLTGGTGGTSVTLVSDGQDMKDRIMQAIQDYDIVIFDGSNGEFTVSTTMMIHGACNKTLVGVNGARIRSQFQLTDDLKKVLKEQDYTGCSSVEGTGGYLSTGVYVGESFELKVRQTVIDYLHDEEEIYRQCGLFFFTESENVIIRNLELQGPGAFDIESGHLISIYGRSKHFWIDHCDLHDGADGNTYTNGNSDCVTFTWCRFYYTDLSLEHMMSNLISGCDDPREGVDDLNTTFAYCIWGDKINSRIPMARWANVHILNCFYNCKEAKGINPRKEAEFLIEGNYFTTFEGAGKPFSKFAFDVSMPRAYEFRNNYFEQEFDEPNLGTVDMPYEYSVFDAAMVPEILTADNGAGPNLKNPLKIGR